MNPQSRPFTLHLFLDFCKNSFHEWPLNFFVITIHQVIWPSPGTLSEAGFLVSRVSGSFGCVSTPRNPRNHTVFFWSGRPVPEFMGRISGSARRTSVAYCTSMCVRVGCTRFANCVDSKPKKKKSSNPDLVRRTRFWVFEGGCDTNKKEHICTLPAPTKKERDTFFE